MLGDSLKRRHGGASAPAPERPPRRRTRFSWRRWSVLALAVLILSFGAGYLLATQVIFPRPETAGRGVPVPELYGQMQSEAEATIRTVGLEVGPVRAIKSMATETGRVLAQDPLPGQQLLPGAAVSLGVSAGPPELRVPPLVGLGEATARDLLETLGFDVVVQQARNTAYEAGIVVRSDPPPGTEQRLPVRVTLVVSTGPPSDSLADTLSPGRFR